MKDKTFVFQFLGYELRVTSYHILALIGLIVLYFLTRVFHLAELPVFCDEGIYIRWSQIMRNEPSLRFIPLQDGKQPLFMWLTIPFLKVFNNPLIAGRMVSVFSGFITLLGVISLPIIISQSITVGLISGLIYILTPFSLFFDRMALVDSLLAAFGIWSLNFSLLLFRSKRLDLAMILGMILGCGLLTKSPGLFFYGLAMATVIFSLFKKQKFVFPSLIKTLLLLLTSTGIAFMMYNILRLGTNFHMLGLRNQDYIRSFSEIISNPIRPTLARLGDIFRYYWYYLTPPLLLLGVIGIVRRFRVFRKIWVILLLWLFGPLAIQALIAKTFTARYILFSVPVFKVLSGYGLSAVIRQLTKIHTDGQVTSSLTHNAITLLTFLLIFSFSLIFDYHLWFSPAKANFPNDEHKGYLEDWTAGWGIVQVADYLKNQPKDENIIVGTEGHFGTLPDGLQIYLEDEKNITVIGVGYPIKEIPSQLENAKQAGDEVYLVVNDSRYKIGNKEKNKLVLIEEYQKPGGDKLLFLKLKD